MKLLNKYDRQSPIHRCFIRFKICLTALYDFMVVTVSVWYLKDHQHLYFIVFYSLCMTQWATNNKQSWEIANFYLLELSFAGYKPSTSSHCFSFTHFEIFNENFRYLPSRAISFRPRLTFDKIKIKAGIRVILLESRVIQDSPSLFLKVSQSNFFAKRR